MGHSVYTHMHLGVGGVAQACPPPHGTPPHGTLMGPLLRWGDNTLLLFGGRTVDYRYVRAHGRRMGMH